MFTDIYNRMYMDSSPVVRRFRKKPVTISKINPPQLSPDDDILVKSFFANEDTLPYFGWILNLVIYYIRLFIIYYCKIDEL